MAKLDLKSRCRKKGIYMNKEQILKVQIAKSGLESGELVGIYV